MSLFDIFSSSSGKKAANQAYAATTSGLNSGLNAAQKYTGLARNDVKAGQKQALGYLDQGSAAARGDYMSALEPYAALAPLANQGYAAYGDAAGLGGQEGYDRAFANFRADPGYQWQQEQGQEAILRNANARGMLSAGNTSQDLLKYAQGLADQTYGNYVSRLAPYLELAPQLAGAQSNIYQQLADLSRGTGAAKAGITSNAATQLSGLYDRFGQTANQSRIGVGMAGAQNAQDRYAAEQGASANLWNALLSAAGGVTGAAGQAGSFSKLFA